MMDYGTAPPRQSMQASKVDPRMCAAPYIAEFVGTFALVFAVGCCIITGNPSWNATGVGCALMVLMYALAPVSGGHFNPAVSVALGLTGKLRLPVVIGYVTAQLAAGILAGCAYSSLFRRSVVLGPKSPFSGWEAAMVEVFYTAMLCFVFLNVSASKRLNPQEDRNQFFALAVGFVVIAGGYAAGDVSGALFNPAVSLGLDLTGYDRKVYWGFHYSLCELLGACIASLLFYVCRREEFVADINIEEYKPRLSARLASEFIGTFSVMFTYGLDTVMKQGACAWSTAAALACMIYSLGSVSGAHFNPAVTLAVVLSARGKCKPFDGMVYCIVQALAGICAGLACAHIKNAGPFSQETFAQLPGQGYSWNAVYVAELAFTALLVFVVLSVATTAPPTSLTKQNFYYALAIGSCVTAGGVAVGAVSGAELNPAIALGVSTIASCSLVTPPPFLNCLGLSCFELLGSVVALLVFVLVRPEEFPLGKGQLLGFQDL